MLTPRELAHATAWWCCAALILFTVYVLGSGCSVRWRELPAPPGVSAYRVEWTWGVGAFPEVGP